MKKTSILSMLLVVSLAYGALSQTLVTQVKPAGSKLWGYANLKGDMIIPASYEKCYAFSPDGLAAVYNAKEKQFYFINLKGEKLPTEITGFKLKDGLLSDFEGFSDGLIQLKTGDQWGYMNASGKLVIPAKFAETSKFDAGYAWAKTGSAYVVLDTKGTETKVEGPVADMKEFTEHLAIFRANDKKFGFIGTDGKIAIPARYESVGYFTNGLAWAKSDAKTGYINPKGEWVIKPQFDAVKNFDAESGLARIKLGEAWGYVNKAGETTFIKDTETFGDFSEGLADGKKNDKKGFYNNKGEWVIAPAFDGTRDFKNGYAAAKKGDKWGMIDKQGKWVMEPRFDGIKDMEVVK